MKDNKLENDNNLDNDFDELIYLENEIEDSSDDMPYFDEMSESEINDLETDEIDEDIVLIDENEDEDDSDDEEEEDSDDELMFKLKTNNHKIEGKHALNRDTIFKGKIDDVNQDFDHSGNPDGIVLNEGFPIEVGTNYEFESRYNEEYVNRLELSQDVYDVLKEKTDLDFSLNRRKPNKQAFNRYFKLLIENIGSKYTRSEIFVELAYYFTDNIFNMFKLLDKEHATKIIIDLKKNGYLKNLNNINYF